MMQLIQLVSEIMNEGAASSCYMRYSAGFAPLMPYLKRKLGQKRLIIEVNSLGSRRLRFLQEIDSRALRSADLIVAVSDQVADDIRSLIPGSTIPILVVPNGVDVDRFVLPDRPETNRAAQPSVGYVGVLKPDYGIEDLIAAMEIVWCERPDVQLSIVGDGPLRASLEDRAKALAKLHLIGPVSFEKVPALLRSLDILVCTQSLVNSHVSPIKLFEYLAAGRPVIAASVPQVARLALESGAFLTYQCGNELDLAHQIMRLLKSKPERDSLAMRARIEAKRHSWDARLVLVRDALQALG